ncbi:hypothetical protein ANN_18926, partial [Periplaneta americana]
FLVTGDSFKTISFSYRLGHSTIHNIVKETCEAIIEELMHEVMPHPTWEMWKAIAKDFQELKYDDKALTLINEICFHKQIHSSKTCPLVDGIQPERLLALGKSSRNISALKLVQYGGKKTYENCP